MKFNKTYRLCTVLIFFTVIVAFNVYAAGLLWDDHGEPFDFYFNDPSFDAHQQSKVTGGKDKLVGFFYIEYTDDEVPPTAIHGTETVGWVLDGVPVEGAVLIENELMEHPVWCLDPEDIPRSQGYTHFHWVAPPEAPIRRSDLDVGETLDGYLLKLTAIDSFYFDHTGGFFITPGIDYDSHYNIVIDEDCANYL